MRVERGVCYKVIKSTWFYCHGKAPWNLNFFFYHGKAPWDLIFLSHGRHDFTYVKHSSRMTQAVVHHSLRSSVHMQPWYCLYEFFYGAVFFEKRRYAEYTCQQFWKQRSERIAVSVAVMFQVHDISANEMSVIKALQTIWYITKSKSPETHMNILLSCRVTKHWQSDDKLPTKYRQGSDNR